MKDIKLADLQRGKPSIAYVKESIKFLTSDHQFHKRSINKCSGFSGQEGDVEKNQLILCAKMSNSNRKENSKM